MPAGLRSALRFLRLALVCLALVWSRAPASTSPVTDAIVLVASAREAAATHADAEPSARAERAAEASAPPRTERGASAGRVTERRSAHRPRRLYIVHRALLC